MKNFYEIKYSDAIDEFGYVTDLDLAKHLIKTMYSTVDAHLKMGNTYQGFMKKVEDELVEFDGGFTFRTGEGRYSFGGPEGWSGLMFQVIEKYEEELKELADGENDWIEDEVNGQKTVFGYLDGKLRCFVVREMD